MVEIKKEGGCVYMSCVQWDDMLAICMEFTEYSKEEPVIKKKKRYNHKECRKIKRFETLQNKKQQKRNRERKFLCNPKF